MSEQQYGGIHTQLANAGIQVGDPVTLHQGVAAMIGALGTNGIIAGITTVATNAGTVPVGGPLTYNFTNSSAATMTITMATTNATDGQMRIVRVYDFSAAAETIAWVNTENGTVTAPTTSTGVVNSPKTVQFQFNGATSKWRTILSA